MRKKQKLPFDKLAIALISTSILLNAQSDIKANTVTEDTPATEQAVEPPQPIAVSLLEAFKEVDQDKIKLLKAMGADKAEIYRYIKFPESLTNFFAAFKIAVSYSVVGAVIAEWLGGYKGLGVYMIRVQKNYSFDKMFAVIFLISAISLILMKLVSFIQKKMMPWTEEK